MLIDVNRALIGFINQLLTALVDQISMDFPVGLRMIVNCGTQCMKVSSCNPQTTRPGND